jgi:hypothetical protein
VNVGVAVKGGDVEIGAVVFSGVGEENGVTLGGKPVGVASGVVEGRSSVGITTSLVTDAKRGMSVKRGVRIVMVESMGGRVGIAPQEDSSTVVNRSISNFRIDFIIVSLL